MATLEKRVQVLFDPERFELLVAAAREHGVSVGAFIREAVDERLDECASEAPNERQLALQRLFARAEADPGAYPPFDWEEAKKAYENEMDPMWRLHFDVQGDPR